MKKIHLLKYMLAGVTVMFAATSCGDKFLEIDYPTILPGDFMFLNEDNVISGLNGVYDALLTNGAVGEDGVTWGFKPQVMTSSFPALDCVASGWDNEFTRHAWKSDKGTFMSGWQIAYYGISRANTFIAGLESADASMFTGGETTKNILDAEARGVRAYLYLFLAKTFGPVPMLMDGETYSNTPDKPRAASMDEMYTFILSDFETAANVLDWTPYRGEYGRVTKGMAKAYMAEIKMYQKDFATAKSLLKEVIDSKTYGLMPCFGKIWDFENAWCKEDVWCIGYPKFSNMGWGAMNTAQVSMWWGFMCAGLEYGGWGSLQISFEFCNSFEPGDKRLQYSVVEYRKPNPFTGEVMGAANTKSMVAPYYVSSENMPNNASLKYWRSHPGNDNIVFEPISVHTLRYSELLLNYAECCFETNDAPTGWQYIDQVRNRAWGNLEVGSGMEPVGKVVNGVDYRLPLNATAVTVPAAQTYYASYKRDKYKSDAWKVALVVERRHEFNAEFALFPAICRMGMAAEYFDAEYPKGQTTVTDPMLVANYTKWFEDVFKQLDADNKAEAERKGETYNPPSAADLANRAAFIKLHTEKPGLPALNRQWDWDPNHAIFPIPLKEISANNGISPSDQNPGY